MFSEYKKHFLQKYSNFHAKFTFKMCLNLIACLEIILVYLKLKVKFFIQSPTEIFRISVFNVGRCLGCCLPFRPFLTIDS